MISAVGAVYKNDEPNWVEEAIVSLLNQTYKIDEIILVVDGPIPTNLTAVLKRYKEDLKLITVSTNKGLANALNIGIKEAKNEFILRFDSDDINVKTRVEKTIQKLEEFNFSKYYIIGSLVKEFGYSNGIRKVPENDDQIKKQLAFRSVVNHPTVLFSKDIFTQIGGYELNVFPEDYFFWLKAKKNGVYFYNIQQPLVLMRTNKDFYKRRSGKEYLAKEIRFLRLAHKSKLINSKCLIINLSLRIPLRLLPLGLISLLYKKYLRN